MENKALEIAKQVLEDKFAEDCIDELESENCGIALDYIGEVIWEELNFDIEENCNMEVFENLFYELQENYLAEKRDGNHETNLLAQDYRNSQIA